MIVFPTDTGSRGVRGTRSIYRGVGLARLKKICGGQKMAVQRTTATVNGGEILAWRGRRRVTRAGTEPDNNLAPDPRQLRHRCEFASTVKMPDNSALQKIGLPVPPERDDGSLPSKASEASSGPFGNAFSSLRENPLFTGVRFLPFVSCDA
jgi:hypothetical protein